MGLRGKGGGEWNGMELVAEMSTNGVRQGDCAGREGGARGDEEGTGWIGVAEGDART